MRGLHGSELGEDLAPTRNHNRTDHREFMRPTGELVLPLLLPLSGKGRFGTLGREVYVKVSHSSISGEMIYARKKPTNPSKQHCSREFKTQQSFKLR